MNDNTKFIGKYLASLCDLKTCMTPKYFIFSFLQKLSPMKLNYNVAPPTGK